MNLNRNRFRPTSFVAKTESKPPPVKDYFDEDDDDDNEPMNKGRQSSLADDDDDDPLDSFMAGITKQIVSQSTQPPSRPAELPQIVSGADELDEDFYLNNLKPAKSSASRGNDSDSEAELIRSSGGDEEQMKKKIEPLPRVDHSAITYPSFKKALYKESAAVASWAAADVDEYRQEHQVSVLAADDSINTPKPLRTFADAGFDAKLRQEIERQGFQQPTPIQSQAIPIVLSGYDILGLAKTGSGKTLAYFWPMLLHVVAQPQVAEGEGPIGLILAPTRELVQQIHQECRKYAKVYNVHIIAIYGGAGKWEMSKQLKNERPEVVVATPGRFIDLVKSKATNLQRCTMVILDEADRMFELGFEYQMRSIVQNIRPDRQVLLFSATMKKKIETFARDMLHPTQHIRVVIGTIGQANPDIRQEVCMVQNDDEKWLWLASEVDAFAAEGKVLIFTAGKADTEVLKLRLQEYLHRRKLDIVVDTLHGDKDGYDRRMIMKRFSAKVVGDVATGAAPGSAAGSSGPPIAILIATDIAARGLDVQDIRTVINFDVPKNIETYVHRIGRTGRMNTTGIVPGTAYTLLTPKDSSFAVDLVQNLRLSQQNVTSELLQLAQRDAKWHRIKHFSGGAHYGGDRPHHGGSQRGGLGTAGGPVALTSKSVTLSA
eukprot:gene5920-4253_t